MTTLANRPNRALLVIDVQVGVVAAAHNRNVVIANIAALIGRVGSCIPLACVSTSPMQWLSEVRSTA